MPESIGVIFDCDGTLVDSEPLAGEAWAQTLEPYGYVISEEDVAAVVGRSYTFTHAYLAERVEGFPRAAVLWPQMRAILFGLYDTRLVAFEDAREAMADLQVRQIAMAVASSSVRERLDYTLAATGYRFAVSVAGDEVEHGKPAPDMFLVAAERLGVDPARCVVIEDSPPGVAAGRAAGMRTLAVCRTPGTESSLAGADRVVHKIAANDILGLL